MKLRSSDNYYATAPKAFPLETFYSQGQKVQFPEI